VFGTLIIYAPRNPAGRRRAVVGKSTKFCVFDEIKGKALCDTVSQNAKRKTKRYPFSQKTRIYNSKFYERKRIKVFEKIKRKTWMLTQILFEKIRIMTNIFISKLVLFRNYT
jgi:hypothetical protein